MKNKTVSFAVSLLGLYVAHIGISLLITFYLATQLVTFEPMTYTVVPYLVVLFLIIRKIRPSFTQFILGLLLSIVLSFFGSFVLAFLASFLMGPAESGAALGAGVLMFYMVIFIVLDGIMNSTFGLLYMAVNYFLKKK